jgi:hypothetical protein
MRVPRVPTMILPVMRVTMSAAVLVRMSVRFVMHIVVHLFRYQRLLYAPFPLFCVFAGYHSAALITHFDTLLRRII